MAETGHVKLDDRLDPGFRRYNLPLVHALSVRMQALRRPGLTPAEQYEWLMLRELLGHSLAQPATVGQAAEETSKLFSRTFLEWLEWAKKQNVDSGRLLDDMSTAWQSIAAIARLHQAP